MRCRHVATALLAILVLTAAACYSIRRSSGGGQTDFQPPRVAEPADVALPAGYRIEVVATDLTFPTGVTFDERGHPVVVESGYSYGEKWTTPRLVRIRPDGTQEEIATGGRNGPWNGVTYTDGVFFVAEGGELEGGRILRISADGRIEAVVDGLPSMGDHHTNGPIVGPDGAIYFGQGTATNSAVVGPDNADFGWLKRRPDFHDTPCERVELAGENFTSDNPLTGNGRATTGAFSPFGTSTRKGQVIEGRVPCNGAVMKVAAAGGAPELVAWGFRNPFGLAFAPDGTLYVTDNSYDGRGSRPLWGGGDLLIEVTPGTWYGWPDFHGDRPLTADQYDPPGGPQPRPLLARHPNPPPKPAAVFGVHASADGLDFSRSEGFGHVGQAFVALFGDMAPAAGKVLRPVGFKVVRVDVSTGVIHDFAVNRTDAEGPATRVGSRGLERPVAVRFDRAGRALYVVDFGVMLISSRGPLPHEKTGVLWRITRDGTP